MAVLITSTEKAAYTQPPRRMGLSLGQFFRKSRSAYASANVQGRAELAALETGLKQLEFGTARNEAALYSTPAKVLADLRAD